MKVNKHFISQQVSSFKTIQEYFGGVLLVV